MTTDPMREAFEILRHSGNPKLIRIRGLKIIKMPECEGGGYAITGEVAEAIAALSQPAKVDVGKVAKVIENEWLRYWGMPERELEVTHLVAFTQLAQAAINAINGGESEHSIEPSNPPR